MGRWAAYHLCCHLASSFSSPKTSSISSDPTSKFLLSHRLILLFLAIELDCGSAFFGENFVDEVKSNEDRVATAKIFVNAFLY